MFDMIAGSLLLITFLMLIYYCMKGGNLLVGFIVTAILWCFIGQVPMYNVVTDVFQKSVESYGATIAIIVFGAWFGRILVDTGIAGYIIKKTVELAGDKPLITALLLCLVCALTRLLQLAEHREQTEWNNLLVKCGLPHFFMCFHSCYATDML